MRKLVVAILILSALAGVATGAFAVNLSTESTGVDWVLANADERAGWTSRMAELFNKDGEFAAAVDECLSQSLSPAEGALEEATHEELRQSELPVLTAACITSLSSQVSPVQ